MLIFKNVNFYIIISFILYNFNLSLLYSNETYGNSFIAIKEEYLGKNQQFLNNSNIKIIIQDEVEESHEVSMVVKIPQTLKDTNKIFILVDFIDTKRETKIDKKRTHIKTKNKYSYVLRMLNLPVIKLIYILFIANI